MNFITNVNFPRDVIEGDSFDFTATVDADLTGYKARCKIYDSSSNEIDLNTLNDTGSDAEILITPGTTSTVLVNVAKSLTDTFESKLIIELQIENAGGTAVKTIFKTSIEMIQLMLSED